jgi:hypothetical protein
MRFYIWLLFGKFPEKIKFSLISDKNNEYITCRTINIFDHIKLSFLGLNNYRTKDVEETKTHIFGKI